ncbi:MAG: DegT/DnrJ/EryC1/StrS aminotransferase family protein [Balneolaceae bacterium]|nr:DegT/DnrJ/EryC1/StrS aminotransferase family protein [Balneolaceae bacterium]
MKKFLRNFQPEPINYGNAGHAFYDVMKWVQANRPKSKPNIIMPSYIPGKLYRFVMAAGYETKFYDVSTQLDFSVDEIRGLIDDQTQMVFAVHFFGVPVDMEPLKNLTSELDVFLMEDCSHTMDSHLNGKTLGTTGDFTIFSIRKMLQFHCGGFLILNNKPWPFQPSTTKKVKSLLTGYHLLGSRIKYKLNHYNRGKNVLQKTTIPVIGYIDYDEEQTVTVKRMDRLLNWLYPTIDLEKITLKRRENVGYLWNHIDDLESFTPIGFDRLSQTKIDAHNTTSSANSDQKKYQLIEGYVPFSLPILTPPYSRNFIQQELLSKGIICYIGWTEAPFGLEGFPGTEQLQMRLLELPIHHHINQAQLDIMADCLNSLEIPEIIDTYSIKAGSEESIF